MPGIQIEVEDGLLFTTASEQGDIPFMNQNRTLECAWQGTGAALIVQERARQQEVEGYNEQDYQYTAGDLAQAALAYTYLGTGRHSMAHSNWPWSMDYFRPNDTPIRALTKAGALIAAELDRLLALENNEAGQPPQTTITGLEF